jgi:hypothetical protein
LASDNDPSATENEFVASWDNAASWFAALSTVTRGEHLKPLLNLITLMRKRGYDHQLRAGSTLGTFILSRSRQHGLRSEQPRLEFHVAQHGGMTVTYREYPDINVQVDVKRVELTAEVEELLARLPTHPID